MFFYNRDKKLVQEIEDFFKIAQKILLEFNDTVKYFVENGIDEHFAVLVQKIAEEERDADDIRRRIERKMFSHSLLPETRKDILEILEQMDNVPDHCESSSYILLDQGTEILPEIKKDLIELVGVTIKCFDYAILAALDFLGKMENIESFVREVDNYEGLGDKLEREMIKRVFATKSLNEGQKLLQKEIIQEIGEICDKTKHIAERITIAAIKRRV